MNNLSRSAIFVAVTFAASINAKSIIGKVLTIDGTPVENAKVELEGTNREVITNDVGEFVLQNVNQGTNELHVRAVGFAHLHEDVIFQNEDSINLTFTLARSPIEVIDVVATPIHLSSMESAMPLRVIGGEALRRQQTATLGDSLESVPGVHTNFHGKVASTPIIRGLSGPRVLIAQNGLDVSDVSRVGPDHSVSSEASTAEQIEVLRGPATLFYGSGAIGGVVNIIDKSVPQDNDFSGEWLLQHSSVDDQNLGSFNLTTGTENFAFYADGYFRQSNDYEIPVDAESEHEDKEHESQNTDNQTIENSSEDSSGFTLGASYLLPNGYIGMAVEQIDREYGIPGHSHGEEEHHDDDTDEHDEDEHSEHSDENVFAELKQTKFHLHSELNFEDSIINAVKIRAGYTDYEHVEIESGDIGTTFKNKTYEFRFDALHQTLAEFNGGLSFHYKQSDVEALGDEAFTPPSKTEMFAASIIEERHLGDVLLQLGARLEHISLTADQVLLPAIDAHGHDDEHTDESSHDDEEYTDEHTTQVFAEDRNFTPMSLSAGIVWDFHTSFNFGLALSRSQRAPSASELYSFGPHIGTGTFEVGALFELEEHDGDGEFVLSDQSIDMETSNNIDLTLRKTQGDVGFIFNVFYNQVDNYYYQVETGLFAEDGHDHGSEEHQDEEHEESANDEHSGELPVFLFQTDDVVLNGFEAQIAWQINNNVNAMIFSDFVRARLKNGGDLARTPPLRFGTQLSYENDSFSSHLEITRFQSQSRVAEFETSTEGYTLVDLHLTYTLPFLNQSMAVYFRGENLTDTEARVHTSFLKDVAPRPGRNLTMGIKGYF
jgi:iron complex outermembrane receptor protein